jgi:Dolichyl-phosphate-mannose-protein mannosyltransferase
VPNRTGTERHRLPLGVWLVAVGFVAIELAVSARYGFHRDELYFLACARHLSLGYVDQPAFVPLVARIASAVSSTPTALRVLPALAGGATVVVAALIARRLGGHRPAMLLAALATACTPAILGADHLLSTTPFDLLVWVLLVYVFIAAVDAGVDGDGLLERGPWIGVGVVAGLGLWNKNLPLLLLAGLGIALVLVGPRRVLLRPGPWLGLLVMLVLWAPQLIWQASHGWPALAMSRALHAEHSGLSDYLTVIPAQFVYAGVLLAPLWVTGLVWLLRRPDLRYLGVAMLLVVGFVAVWTPGRPYYTLGLYPMLYAAGSVAVERRVLERTGRRRLPAGWVAAALVSLAVAVPLALPVLPEAVAADIHALHKINYDAGETVGWPSLAAQVAAVYDTLPADQRAAGAAIVTGNYGEAGAIDEFGRSRDLPYAFSGQNTYGWWGPPTTTATSAILVGADPPLQAAFASCTQVATIRSPHNFNNDENGTPIYRCSGRTESWSKVWPQVTFYG